MANASKTNPYFNIYALSEHAETTPTAGALAWTRSTSAEPNDLDLQIVASHVAGPGFSPTGAAIVLA